MSESERFVPKIHPATRPVEPEDPMTLTATAVAGDPEVMLRCVIQEYAWMGWSSGEILELFYSPCYPALQGLLSAYGEDDIRGRIERLLEQTGVLRVQAVVHEPPPPCREPELVQISMPDTDGENRAQGATHA